MQSRRRPGAAHPLALLVVLVLLGLSFTALAQQSPPNPTVTTDRGDYAPGDTVKGTGSGFHANETVTLQVTYADGTLEPNFGDATPGYASNPWTVTTDANGAFSATWQVDP